MLGYCQSAMSAIVAETAQVETRAAPSCLSQQLPTDPASTSNAGQTLV